MGFSWSSFIAQEVMTHVCRGAGLSRSLQLADDLPGPASAEAFGLATDDVVFFTAAGYARSEEVMHRLDCSFARHRVERHALKDVTGVADGTAIGIDLVGGTCFKGNAHRVGRIVVTVVALLDHPRLRPIDMSVLLGSIQWLHLLNRQLFGVLHACYGFARLEPNDVVRDIPATVRLELMHTAALFMLWTFDVTAPWLPELIATDASPAFGFGVCRARCSPRLARELGRLAERRGDYVALLPAAGAAAAFPSRLGTAHRLNIRRSRFRTVICSRCRHQGHPGLLEAHALRLGIEWILRSAAKHGTRAVMLVDAKAVLGASARGRTSARTLRKQVGRISALLLAGDLGAHLLYIPSEDNPADAPSRGASGRDGDGTPSSSFGR